MHRNAIMLAGLVVALATALPSPVSAHSRPAAATPAAIYAVERIEQRGGWVVRDKDGRITDETR